jgi:hypothetical protein
MIAATESARRVPAPSGGQRSIAAALIEQVQTKGYRRPSFLTAWLKLAATAIRAKAFTD